MERQYEQFDIIMDKNVQSDHCQIWGEAVGTIWCNRGKWNLPIHGVVDSTKKFQQKDVGQTELQNKVITVEPQKHVAMCRYRYQYSFFVTNFWQSVVFMVNAERAWTDLSSLALTKGWTSDLQRPWCGTDRPLKKYTWNSNNVFRNEELWVGTRYSYWYTKQRSNQLWSHNHKHQVIELKA